jgi:succinate dehydrogenase/fumarate reductase-like Fe-S protein
LDGWIAVQRPLQEMPVAILHKASVEHDAVIDQSPLTILLAGIEPSCERARINAAIPRRADENRIETQGVQRCIFPANDVNLMSACC